MSAIFRLSAGWLLMFLKSKVIVLSCSRVALLRQQNTSSTRRNAVVVSFHWDHKQQLGTILPTLHSFYSATMRHLFKRKSFIPSSNDEEQQHSSKEERTPLHIVIQHCPSWGMPSHARSLKKFLKQQSFGSHLKISSTKEKRVTGGFVVVAEGKVLHQRSRRVGGLCRTVQERQALVEEIESMLSKR